MTGTNLGKEQNRTEQKKNRNQLFFDLVSQCVVTRPKTFMNRKNINPAKGWKEEKNIKSENISSFI